MAIENWIAMRVDLHEDPDVIRIAEKMQVRSEVVVGYLHRVWSWFDKNSADGRIHGCALTKIEEVLTLPGFLRMMCEVGWLEVEPGLIVVPNWERWMSNTAKRRLKDSKRKLEKIPSKRGKNSERVRKVSSSSSSSSSSPEGECEGKPPDKWNLPDGWDRPEVLKALDDWAAMRRQIKKPVLSRANTSRIFKRFDSPDHLIFAAETCIANGYQGLKPEYRPEHLSHPKTGSRPVTFAEQSSRNVADMCEDFMAREDSDTIEGTVKTKRIESP